MFPSQKLGSLGKHHPAATASMGPGCFHPRNALEMLCESLNASGLQWGRDVSIPEMSRRSAARAAPRGFNGAGMFPSQKSARADPAKAVGPASMGPGCFHPRNLNVALLHYGYLHASMGPGCFHPRNLDSLCPGRAGQLASMGPGCFHPRNNPLQDTPPQS